MRKLIEKEDRKEDICILVRKEKFMKNFKNYLLGITLAILLFPSVTFAKDTSASNTKDIVKAYSIVKNKRLMLSVKDFAKDYDFEYTDEVSTHPVTNLKI